jgi:type II secretory pathway pseudopilin PulG
MAGDTRRPARALPHLGRRAFSLLELTVASVLIGGLMLSVVPTLAWIVRERQAADRQQAAAFAVGNLMERVTALAFDDLTDERLAAIALPESIAKQLPEAALKIMVQSHPESPDARRISIELSWLATSSTRAAPVKLAAWVYRNERSRA